ncbi:hypothetical protein BKH43_04825 [Helicobacter sp. 13S00401-1]|uniref:M48 family metallopeptidase n=1 Tax=Helicobacter sp. 13S00401-1 TaxID=1905758 RepID=UPI000BA7BDF2|nr:SprT family zinc-dependent metalloprotease [Helicobacter sp. 13S00401-1]PAF50419.1 hypothetical protein BKH43_04825 [Helicobacter sp. 13S00401-1]
MLEDLKIIKKDIKNIILRIKLDGSISLSVPKRVGKKYIQEFLEKKSSWIESKLSYIKSLQASKPPTQKDYISGEDFFYLGKSYTLKVIESKVNKVVLLEDTLNLYIKDVDNKIKKQSLIKAWYKKQAFECFQSVIDRYAPIVKKEVKALKVREMKTRWGSCNHSKAYINLNLSLVKYPLCAIEYVVFHELAHLIHPNHSPKFWSYIKAHMSDYKQRSDMLKTKLA